MRFQDQKSQPGAIFRPPKIFRKSHPAERKGASTSALGPQGRELSGNCSEGYEDKGASAKPPGGHACNILAQEALGSQNHRKGKGTRESRQNPFKGTCLKNVPFGTLLNPEKVQQQGGQNQLYASWPQTCVSKLKKVALEPFFAPRKFPGNRTQQGRRVHEQALSARRVES